MNDFLHQRSILINTLTANAISKKNLWKPDFELPCGTCWNFVPIFPSLIALENLQISLRGLVAFHNLRVMSPKGLSILVLIGKYIWCTCMCVCVCVCVCMCVVCMWERVFECWYQMIPHLKESTWVFLCLGFPGVSEGKKFSYNTGDLGLIPGLERSPGGSHGSPLHYYCLENPHGQRSLAGYCPWGRQEWDMIEWLRTFLCWFICENNWEMIEDWQSWFKNWRAWSSISGLFYLLPSCPYRN